MKNLLKSEERKLVNSFKDFYNIQNFLDETPYNEGKNCKSPLFVLRERKAHCAEGAYFAASMLRQHGYEPLVVDLLAERDDDHVLAVFKYKGYWGAISKSNTTLLRGRSPVYKSVRELVMSYFDFYFNVEGERSLISFSRPINLKKFDKIKWESTDADLNFIGDSLTDMPHVPILTKEMKKVLPNASKGLLEACFLGANQAGLYRP